MEGRSKFLALLMAGSQKCPLVPSQKSNTVLESPESAAIVWILTYRQYVLMADIKSLGLAVLSAGKPKISVSLSSKKSQRLNLLVLFKVASQTSWLYSINNGQVKIVGYNSRGSKLSAIIMVGSPQSGTYK
jgi:hypothetical protein